MSIYDDLHTTAFCFNREGISQLSGPFSVLRFPSSWREPILELQRRRRPQQKQISIANLNNAIRALVPDVAAVKTKAGFVTDPGEWLYCAAQPEIEGLSLILLAWLHSSVGKEHEAAAYQLWEQLVEISPLEWETAGLDAFTWPHDENVQADTPAATDAIQNFPGGLFSLLPEILTAELLRRCDRPPDFLRSFRRCPSSGRGAELLSWPPLKYTNKTGEGYFSYRIRFSVQTVPFQPAPFLYVHSGLRRWCTDLPKIRSGESAKAYLLTDVSWIQGIEISRSFRTAPMRWSKVNGEWNFTWEKKTGDIFSQEAMKRGFISDFPDPAVFTKSLPKYMQDLGEDKAVAIVHNPGAGNKHLIGAGVSARDRHDLMTWIGETLSDLLIRAQPLQRTPVQFAKQPELPSSDMRARLAVATESKPLHIEIHWNTPAVCHAIRAEIIKSLDLAGFPTQDTDSSETWTTPELTVTLKTCEIGALADTLAFDPQLQDRGARRIGRAKRARDSRISDVRRSLEPVSGMTLTIVEILGRDAFPDPATDPKSALRAGFALSQRLTQFLTPEMTVEKKDAEEKSSLSHRVEAAWGDLLRQCTGSLRPVRPKKRSGVKLSDEIDTVGIYLLRRNKKNRYGACLLPIATWTSSDSPLVWARVAGMESWQPYPDVLLRLATEPVSFLSENQRILRVIEEMIRSTRRDRPTLLLTWTQNLRWLWKELQNGHLLIDSPRLNNLPLLCADSHLRHVLVRTEQSDETPECYGLRENAERAGLPSGLFRLPGSERVFASIGKKPSSAKNSASPMSSRREALVRINGKEGSKMKALEVKRNTFNYQYVELTVAAMQKGDDPLSWAALTHCQRDLADTYKSTTVLPLPLHLAKQAAEYVLPDLEEEEPDDDFSL